MMTAVEFVINPVEAMIMAQIRTHMLVPVILPPDKSLSRISSCDAASSFSENIFRTEVFSFSVFSRIVNLPVADIDNSLSFSLYFCQYWKNQIEN